jgi:acyl carrier protein
MIESGSGLFSVCPRVARVQACRYCNTLGIFKQRHIVTPGRLVECGALNESGGLIMTFSSLSFTQRASAGEGFEVGKIRALIATRLGIDVRRVTDDAHFSDDLGADWLDRLELLILIEDQFSNVEIMDGDADQIECVGDLIRYLETARVESMPGYRRVFASGIRPA